MFECLYAEYGEKYVTQTVTRLVKWFYPQRELSRLANDDDDDDDECFVKAKDEFCCNVSTKCHNSDLSGKSKLPPPIVNPSETNIFFFLFFF